MYAAFETGRSAGSQWYADSYTLLTGKNLAPQEDAGSWISRTWKKLF